MTRRNEQGVALALTIVALGTMLAPLNSTMIAVALPTLLDDFGKSLAWGAWIVTSYLVAMAVVQPLAGSLGDRLGRKRMFVLGLWAFLASTVVAGLAWNIELLIVARTAQAISGAASIPNGTALVRSLVPRERQGQAFGTVGAAVALAAGLGPPIGGLVTDAFGWRFIFLANVLLLVPAIALSARLPEDAPTRAGAPFDWRGAALLATGLTALVLSLTVWRLAGVPIVTAPMMAMLALACAAGLRQHLRRATHPALNIGLFRRRAFTAASATVLLTNLAMYTVLLSLPVFLTKQEDWSSGAIGLLIAGMSLQMVLVAPLSGRLSDRAGRRAPSMAGAACMAVGLAPLLALDNHWTWPMLLGPLIVVGIGVGLVTAPIQTAAIEAAAHGESGQAAGLFSTMRYFGSILGSAGMAAVLSANTPSVGEFRLLYAVLLVAVLAAVGTAFGLPGRVGAPMADAPLAPAVTPR